MSLYSLFVIPPTGGKNERKTMGQLGAGTAAHTHTPLIRHLHTNEGICNDHSGTRRHRTHHRRHNMANNTPAQTVARSIRPGTLAATVMLTA